MRKPYPCIAFVVPILCLGLVILCALPPVSQALTYRAETLWAKIEYALNPPEKVVFVPEATHVTPFPVTPLATWTPEPAATSTPEAAGPTETPTLSPTPSLTPTPIPGSVTLTGSLQPMYQTFNNCGPANLAMALTYWGWEGDQRGPAEYMKPNARDRNVMPYEMADYVTENTDFGVVVRVGGDLDMIKRFIAAGFPVIIEKGFEGPRFDGWMGHYEVVTAYDDSKAKFIVQDSYDGPNLPVVYDKLFSSWRAFNYTYLVIYPFDREAEVMSILGPHADKAYNYQYAADRAAEEIKNTTGRDLYFAWFNRGASLTNLQQYNEAATAFDAAFANYTSIPEKERPWRMLWYQTTPYFAYFFTQRYQDVINLADTTLSAASEPLMEESYYWRGRAKSALGDSEGAIKDFEDSLKAHPEFSPALEQLAYLGVEVEP